MLVVENNKTYVNWGLGDSVHALEYSGDVVIVIDPSKTNLALIVGTPMRQILNVLEFSGNNRGRGPVMDTTMYCEELRYFLRAYLEKCNLYAVGIEQTILPKGKTAHYHSVTVQNEIQANLLAFFLDEFRVTAIKVNNWSWKSHVLPDGFRSPKEKGSKRYFQTYFPDSPYTYYHEADVTDCICIFWYLCDTKCGSYTLYCNRVEHSLSGFKYTFFPVNSAVGEGLQEVLFNQRFTFDENLAYYSNRILSTFVLKMDTVDVPIDHIYGHSMLFTRDNVHDKQVKVVATRT